MPSVWRSNLYLLASFPVGIFTFVFFVTMLSLGVSLLIIWVGVPILIATVASTKFFAAGERRRALRPRGRHGVLRGRRMVASGLAGLGTRSPASTCRATGAGCSATSTPR